jgi:multidrug efflux pump subunit AcrA (membrane-fusion protein)
MSADVDIKTDERKNIFSIPMRAVKNENGRKYVEILKDEKQGITEKADVTTGMEGDDGMVEIKSGLKGGEKVITLASTK